jgi:cytochrome P450
VNRLLGRSLFNLQNEEWREMRHNLSPAFTGSKLRGMTDLIESACERFSEFLSKRDPNEPLDIFASFRRLGVDIIATTAFGTPCDSINDPENEFFQKGTKIMDFSGLRGFVILGYLLNPP